MSGAKTKSCGDTDDNEVEDEDDEMEDMFVNSDPNFGVEGKEWGGPRRGGRFPEPTRYGDWERKGRATDFQEIRMKNQMNGA